MKHVYYKEIEELKLKEKRYGKISGIYLAGKLLFFVAAVVFVYFSFHSYSIANVSFALLFFILYITICVLDNKCRKQIDLICRIRQVCENEISYLNDDLTPFDDGSKYIDPQHEYSFDLDIFGQDSLFNRINRTVTSKGRDKLAYKLSNLLQNKIDIENVRDAVGELSSLYKWRLNFIAQPFINDNLVFLSQLLRHNRVHNFFINSLLPYMVISLTIILFLCALLGLLSWYYFVLVFVVNLLICMLFYKSAVATHQSIDLLHKEYKGYRDILVNIHNVQFETPLLKKIQRQLFDENADSLKSFKELSRILNSFDQKSNAIMNIMLDGMFLADVILLRRFLKWSEKALNYMDQWIDSIAEIDALVSLGTYAFNNPNNAMAEILDDTSSDIIQTKNIYHPFLSHKKAVPNDFILKKSNIAIITGANMAGKSTFLRTVGVNYVLACNGLPVCAEVFRFSIVTLFSSMRTTDNLSKDISYFNAELLRLKSLMQHVQSKHYTLIILDEILKGTNSKDKLHGSILFLREISKYNVSALIATHDLELAKLEIDNGDLYSNYKFEIELSDDIKYTYKIEQGIAQNLNASYLLSNMLGISGEFSSLDIMSIRRLTEQDIPEIRELFRSTVLNVNSRDYTKEEVEDWASCMDNKAHVMELLSKNCFIAVFLSNKKMIGYSSMDSKGHLHSMFVHKDWQGKGVGTLLISEVEKIAEKYDVSEIVSEVSLTARSFFESKGYTVVKIQKSKARKLELTNFVMRKRL